MRTKIVYILCSDENDIFYEQALLSVFSLRKYNPDAFVELIVDQYTITTINGKRSKIKEYVNSIKVVEVPEKYNRRQLSRWIKTSLRNLIDGDYLFIDTDTIITDCLYDIDNFTGDIGAVKDQHTVVKKNSGKYIMLQWATQDGWSCFDDLLYFNSGVMYVRDCDFTHDFYKEWNKRWQICCEAQLRYFDQSVLAATNEFFEFPIKELDGEWNCQIIYNGITCLANAKIVHYLRYGWRHQAWIFYEESILQEIKREGIVTNRISELIDKAKVSFILPNQIISGNDWEIFRSPLFSICRTHKTFFSIFNYIAVLIYKLKRIKHRLLSYFSVCIVLSKWKYIQIGLFNLNV